MNNTFLFCAALLLSAITFAQIPQPPKSKTTNPIPELKFKTSAEAQAVFKLSDKDCLPVTVDGNMVILPVNFKDTKHIRATWDIDINLDLTMAKGLEFDFYCEDSSEISYTSIYFHSGEGWYRKAFDISGNGVWQHIRIDKAQTGSEDQPAGWDKIDTIRISAWRGGNTKNTFAAIANFGIWGGKPDVTLIRADSQIKNGNPENNSYMSYSTTIANVLDMLDIDSVVVSDLDLQEKHLKYTKIAILPYNPSLPNGKLEILKSFVARGGKLIAFYSLPDGVDKLIGLQNKKWERAPGNNFEGFLATNQRLPGQPDFALQDSNMHTRVEPADKEGKVIATWAGKDKKDTGLAAVTVTPKGAFFGHVWKGYNDGNCRQLILSVLGSLNPDFWRRSAEKEYAGIGVFNTDGINDFAAFMAAFSGKTNPLTAAAVEKTAAKRKEAQKHLDNRDWVVSINASSIANAAAIEAWCREQPSSPDEVRAVWCHSAFGLAGKTWDEAIKFLADCGFNTILVNMCWGLTSYYPSQILEEDPSVASRGDQVKQCLAACEKYGVKCHVWKVCWNSGNRGSKELIAKYRKEGRLQQSIKGDNKGAWLCPSNPLNQKMEIDSMLELIRNYPSLSGVHFDYIRYPGNDTCFCDGCKKRFEESMGSPVPNWPADVKLNAPLYEKWVTFRQNCISPVVQQVYEKVKKLRPSAKVSAAVFENAHECKKSVAQDWELWCKNGWLDFVCPMDYTDINFRFENQCKRQKVWSHGVTVYPGIGLSCWSNSRDPIKLAQQIGITRKAGMKGFTVFNYDSCAEYTFPYMKLGTTAK